MRTGHVFCSARLYGRPLAVVARRLQDGTARCAWKVPRGARGATVVAAVTVEQGQLRAVARFRSRVS
ncbi:MAG TPA: hypothetical protein VLH10_21250 [Yinghuangia sp.]|nr:hypothetical protein [Yinghuangia sp.]